jgi:hypothetical protein
MTIGARLRLEVVLPTSEGSASVRVHVRSEPLP